MNASDTRSPGSQRRTASALPGAPDRANGGAKAGGALAAVRRFVPALDIAVPDWARAWIRPRLPDVVLLFSHDRFTVIRVLAGEKGGRPVLTDLVSRALPAGSLVPRIDRPGVTAPVEVAREVGRVLDQLPDRAKMRRLSVVIPDSSALVVLLTLRELPRSPRQAAEVIRWQIRKRVPFRLEDARLRFQRFSLGDGSERVLVVAVREPVVAQFEQLVESLGLQPGLVDLSTLNLANLVDSAAEGADSGAGDLAVLNVTDERMSFMVLRGQVPLFYRSRSLLHQEATDAAAVRSQVQRELASSVTYYRERLAGKHGGLTRAVLRSALAGDGGLEAVIAEVLGVRPRPLDPAAGLQMSEPPAPDDLQRAAPALGLLLARRPA